MKYELPPKKSYVERIPFVFWSLTSVNNQADLSISKDLFGPEDNHNLSLFPVNNDYPSNIRDNFGFHLDKIQPVCSDNFLPNSYLQFWYGCKLYASIPFTIAEFEMERLWLATSFINWRVTVHMKSTEKATKVWFGVHLIGIKDRGIS